MSKGLLKKSKLINRLIALLERENKIYILPTMFGYYFLLLVFILFMISLTYGHSLAFTATFLFLSLIMSSAAITNFNLRGLDLSRFMVMENQKSHFLLRLRNTSKTRVDLELNLRSQKLKSESLAIVESGAENTVSWNFSHLPRGPYLVRDIILSTTYPVSLFYSWKKFRVDLNFAVPPVPKDFFDGHYPFYDHHNSESVGESSMLKYKKGEEEFYEHRKHEESDTWRLIDWKAYARTNQLFNKIQHSEDQARYLEFDYHKIPRLDHEQKLSQLYFWCLKHRQSGDEFRVILPEETFDCNATSDFRDLENHLGRVGKEIEVL